MRDLFFPMKISDTLSTLREEERPSLYYEDDSIVAAVFGREELRSLAHAGENNDERRREERRFLAERFSLPEESVIFLKQTHSDLSFGVEEPDPGRGLYFAEGDALYTSRDRLLLTIRTADCMPLFFRSEGVDREGAPLLVAGLIHAGWRGMKEGIIRKTLDRVYAASFRNAESFRTLLFDGPGIGGEAYQVGEEVARHFRHVRQASDGSLYLDLPLTLEEEIRLSPLFGTEEGGTEGGKHPGELRPHFRACTYLQNDRFFSHRRGDSERNLNVIMIKRVEAK